MHKEKKSLLVHSFERQCCLSSLGQMLSGQVMEEQQDTL